MAAGSKYYLTPEEEKVERYDVSTGVRRRGAYVLDTTGLAVGDYVPAFTPIAADLVKKTAVIAVNCKVVEAAASDATTIKIEKNSYVAVGMILGTGSKGATVSAIDKTNADYDTVTLSAAFTAALTAGQVLFQATAAGGTTPKNLANSALYEKHKVTEGINLVALLHRAFEIEPDKLVTPFSAKDKANCPHFQFNE